VIDMEDAKPKEFALNEATVNLGGYFTLESEQRWAVEDLSGVKVKQKVQITLLSDTTIRFECRATGLVASVPRTEFFQNVTDYARLYRGTKKRRKAATGSPMVDLDAVMNDLEAALG